LAGSEKRIKELKIAFDTPPRYGKGLDWTGYTVHDAANILRRYFNHLPEPIIPLGNYDSFRQPIRNHQAEAVGPIEGQAPSLGGFDPDAAVRNYQHSIKSLPSLNRQLLLYILDLLAVFAAKADVNKMTTSNLAAIFQPGILSHPQHDMSPQDYRLNQDVLIFLIDNQDHFLIGMEGTAVDEGTVKQIESGPNTPQVRTPTTPGRNNSGINRSASTSSSAGADSLRKYGGVRRNVSTSSRRSRRSGAIPSPITPGFVTPPTSGVHRSNTLPTKRSPALNSPRFANRPSGPSTPTADDGKALLSPNTIESAVANLAQPEKSLGETEVPEVPRPRPSHAAPINGQEQSIPPPPAPEDSIPKRAMTLPPGKIELPKPAFAQQARPLADTPALDSIPGAFPPSTPGVQPPSEVSTPVASVPVASVPASVQAAHALHPPPAPGTGRRSPHMTPTREHSEFIEAPVGSGPPVEPTPAVRTFTQILGKVSQSPSDVKDGKDKDGRKPNKLQKKRLTSGQIPSAHSSTTSLTGQLASLDAISVAPAPSSPLFPPQAPFASQSHARGSREALTQTSNDTFSSSNSGNTLKPSMSPSASFRSHSTATEYSEAELNEEPALLKEEREKERRSFWKGHKRGESKATPTASQTDLHGSVPGGDKSMSSFGSSSGWATGGRRSGQFDSVQGSEATMVFGSPPDGDRSSDKKGTFDWFHKMRHEHRERADKRERAKSPPGSMSNMPLPQNLMRPRDNLPIRDRSTDGPRSTSEGSHDSTPTGNSQATPTASSVLEAKHQASSVAAVTQPQQIKEGPSGPPPATANPVPAVIPEEPAMQPAVAAPALKHTDSATTIQPVTQYTAQPTTEPSSPVVQQPVPYTPISRMLQSGQDEPKTPTATSHPVIHAPSPAIAEILAAPARNFSKTPERGTPSPSRSPPPNQTR
jgi:hypothetical protein